MITSEASRIKSNINPFLCGNFAPVDQEITTSDLSVSGKIPEELQGSFLRIGPNPSFKPNPRSHHWFLGSGMVHGVHFQGGKASSYKNRYVISDTDATALKRKYLPSPRKKQRTVVNTNILAIGGELYALIEAGSLPIKLDSNLESISYSDFSGTLKSGFSAHPRKDPSTGELHVLAYEPGKSSIDYILVDPSGLARTVTQLQAPHQPMIHDVAITANYTVVLDLPVTFDLFTAISGKFPYVWNRKQQPRVGLLPRSGLADQMIWFEAPQSYVYHIMNAFEVDQNIFVDVIKNSMNFDANIFKHQNQQPSLVRWKLDRTTEKLSESALSEYPVEFPRLNDNWVGKEYRYGYTCAFTAELKFGCAYKHDVISGKTLVHDFGSGRSSMEPVFIPKNGSSVEDDGWIMSYVFDQNTNKTEIVILDAQDFEGQPIATIHLPVRVPYGFHGNWIADETIS